MVACPFQVPAFEFDEALKPDIKKCDFCFERTNEGKIPAYQKFALLKPLLMVRREDLVKAAHQKIKTIRNRYINRVRVNMKLAEHHGSI